MRSKERGGCAKEITLPGVVKFSNKFNEKTTVKKNTTYTIFLCFFHNFLSW